jgi:hypothetical protein
MTLSCSASCGGRGGWGARTVDLAMLVACCAAGLARGEGVGLRPTVTSPAAASR